MLQEAELITSGQLEVALHEQQYFEMLLGEILAQHGWIRQETADFFVESWPMLNQKSVQHPIGHYLQLAHLLDETQVQTILQEQKKIGVRFGSVAVLNGWLKQETLDYFLRSLAPNELKQSAFKTQSGHETRSSRKTNSTYLQNEKETYIQNFDVSTIHKQSLAVLSSSDANDEDFDLGTVNTHLDNEFDIPWIN